MKYSIINWKANTEIHKINTADRFCLLSAVNMIVWDMFTIKSECHDCLLVFQMCSTVNQGLNTGIHIHIYVHAVYACSTGFSKYIK